MTDYQEQLTGQFNLVHELHFCPSFDCFIQNHFQFISMHTTESHYSELEPKIDKLAKKYI